MPTRSSSAGRPASGLLHREGQLLLPHLPLRDGMAGRVVGAEEHLVEALPLPQVYVPSDAHVLPPAAELPQVQRQELVPELPGLPAGHPPNRLPRLRPVELVEHLDVGRLLEVPGTEAHQPHTEREEHVQVDALVGAVAQRLYRPPGKLPRGSRVGEHEGVGPRVDAPEDVRQNKVGVAGHHLDLHPRDPALSHLREAVHPAGKCLSVSSVEVYQNGPGEVEARVARSMCSERPQGGPVELAAGPGLVPAGAGKEVDVHPVPLVPGRPQGGAQVAVQKRQLRLAPTPVPPHAQTIYRRQGRPPA